MQRSLWPAVYKLLECGPMPNVMAALPNIGGASVIAAVWLTPTTTVPCSNAAKTRNPLKFAGCAKLANRSQPLVGESSPYYEDMRRRYCCLTSFFPTVDTCLSCKDTAQQSCAMVPKWWSLHPVFSASHVQHISDVHSKFALRPHYVWKYGRHPTSNRWD